MLISGIVCAESVSCWSDSQLPLLTKSGGHFHVHINIPSDAFNPTDEPFFQVVSCFKWIICRILRGTAADVPQQGLGVGTWEEINQVEHTFVMEISRLEDVAAGEILLFCGDVIGVGGADSKVAALVFIQESTKDRRGIKIWPTYCQTCN